MSGGYDDVVMRYRTLVEQLPLVIYVDALDAASSNIFTSAQIEPLLGYSVAEWASDVDLFLRALHPDDRERVLAAHARTHETHEPLSVEYRLRGRDGRTVWVRDEGVVVFGEDGRPLYLQGYLLDVTAEREAREQLRAMALSDPLTGLANRAFFREQLRQAVALRKEPDHQSALMTIDINDFKALNDRWGHDVGDRVLAAVGRRVQSTIRAGDAAARLGADEFTVVMATVGEPAEAARAAERLLQRIAEPIDVDGNELSVVASIGISLGCEPEAMLKEADAAMQRAKSHRDVGYAFFDPELDTSAVKRSRRVAELRDAVDRGEFTLHYQPIVDHDPREIVGYEALLRWEHPVEGQIAPLDFIPLAEESGLIVPIGRWALTEACAHGARLHAEQGRALRMAVNVSARQLQNPAFVGHVEDALLASGFPAHCLTLELTESVLLASGEHVEQQLRALKAKGITLALDDFGTGYASLTYLQRLPVDIVKIDRSFVAASNLAGSDLLLLKGIIDLGNALGLKLVAEGIETSEQDRLIRALGCDGAQGYFFGRPKPVPARRLPVAASRVAAR